MISAPDRPPNLIIFLSVGSPASQPSDRLNFLRRATNLLYFYIDKPVTALSTGSLQHQADEGEGEEQQQDGRAPNPLSLVTLVPLAETPAQHKQVLHIVKI